MNLTDLVEWTLALVVALMMSISEPPEERSVAQPVQQEQAE